MKDRRGWDREENIGKRGEDRTKKRTLTRDEIESRGRREED